jgi:hypothetical protein
VSKYDLRAKKSLEKTIDGIKLLLKVVFRNKHAYMCCRTRVRLGPKHTKLKGPMLNMIRKK